MSLLAVDMGSSSCKAIAFSAEGQMLAEQRQSYSPEIPRPSWAEMPAEKFWQAFQGVTHRITRAISEPIEALCISSHAETFVAVNENRQPLAPAILNIDNRAVAQADWIAETIGPRRIFEITGLSAHPMYPIPKILWLREHQKEIFWSTPQFLGVTDYLLARLGLPPHIDYSHASRFLAFDVRQRCWSEEILAACDLTADRFATPVPAGTVVGRLSDTVAEYLGLKSRPVVVVGGHDQPCGALGMGVTDAGRVSGSLGTYECLLAASETPCINDAAFSGNLNTYCHVVPDRYVTLAYFPSGIMVDWFLHLLSASDYSAAKTCSELEAQASAGPTGLCIAPHLLGTCNPDFNPHATGVIAGLRPATSAADIYKGVLEGIACELANMAELLRRVAGSFEDVYITGGGCRSRLGLDLRAAMTRCRLHRMRCPEAVCLGTAILAGVGAGTYNGFFEAIAQLVNVADTIEPDARIAESYAAQRHQYQLLYSSLAKVREAQAARTA
jgi:xylulokinase